MSVIKDTYLLLVDKPIIEIFAAQDDAKTAVTPHILLLLTPVYTPGRINILSFSTATEVAAAKSGHSIGEALILQLF